VLQARRVAPPGPPTGLRRLSAGAPPALRPSVSRVPGGRAPPL